MRDPEDPWQDELAAASHHKLAAAYERGEVDLPLLRGRTTRPMAVQYAEIALRRHLDAG